MFELKFAAEVSDLTGTWAVGVLFPYFLPFWYPYILLHFEMFFITCYIYIVALNVFQ